MRRFTKEQKIYVSILTLAAACLLADRLFFGPEEVTAQSAVMDEYIIRPSERDSVTIDSGNAEYESRQSTIANRVADRLDELAATHPIAAGDGVDAFWPAWIPTARQELIENAAQTLSDVQLDAQSFTEDHKMTAVMGTGPRGYVIVDGRPLSIGDELDGFKLVSVVERSAVFEREGLLVELQLVEALPGVSGERRP